MLLEGIIFFAVFFLLFALFLTVVCRDASNFNGLDAVQDMNFGHAFLTRLYYTVTTFSTIGYGDISPASVKARVIIILTIFVFIVLVLQSLENMRSRLMTSLSPLLTKLQPQAAPAAKKKDEAKPATDAATPATATATAGAPDDTNMYFVADGGLTTGSLTYMLPSTP